MHLQQSTRADILARTHRLGETTIRPAAAAAERPGPADATPASVDGIGPDPDVVRAVQRELTHRGYEAGPADGLVHPVTRAAVMAYEHDHGLALSGEPSEDLLKAILFGLTAGDGSNGPRNPQPGAQEIIRSVQQSLASLGYQVSKIDGLLGEETASAIRSFEAQHRLPASGRISGALLLALDKEAVRRQPRVSAR